jgi:hypothetical protein
MGSKCLLTLAVSMTTVRSGQALTTRSICARMILRSDATGHLDPLHALVDKAYISPGSCDISPSSHTEVLLLPSLPDEATVSRSTSVTSCCFCSRATRGISRNKLEPTALSPEAVVRIVSTWTQVSDRFCQRPSSCTLSELRLRREPCAARGVSGEYSADARRRQGARVKS